MFDDIIKIEEFNKLEIEVKKKNLINTIHKLLEIRKIYELELKNKDKNNFKNYIEDKMSIKILLSEISTINEQLHNFNLRKKYYEDIILNKNIEIEKLKILSQKEKDLEIIKKEERENEELQDFINIYSLSKLKS